MFWHFPISTSKKTSVIVFVCSGDSSNVKPWWVVPEAAAGHHQVGLCGPEDVVDGSSSQHLPHGFIDHLLIVPAANGHGALETHNKHLLQEGICRDIQTSAAGHRSLANDKKTLKHSTTTKGEPNIEVSETERTIKVNSEQNSGYRHSLSCSHLFLQTDLCVLQDEKKKSYCNKHQSCL